MIRFTSAVHFAVCGPRKHPVAGSVAGSGPLLKREKSVGANCYNTIMQ